MIRARLIFPTVLLVVGVLWTSTAFAQNRYGSSRAFSPWMNMFQRYPGTLDNYHSFVKPDLELQRTLSQQNNALMQNAAGIQMLGQQVQNGQVRPTGTGSVFMEYSHYYPSRGGNNMARPRSRSR
jgi:hypothetical protein